MKNFSFKRFFTFGLGMGKTASAPAGFVNSTKTYLKERWDATGWRFIAGGVGGGLAVFAIYMAGALSAMDAHAQTTTGVTTTNTTVQGDNTSVTSRYTTTITGGSLGYGGDHVVIGGAGKNTAITGNSTKITTTTTNIGTGGGTVTVTGDSSNLNAKKTTINGIDTVVNNQKTTMSGALVVGATGDQRTGQNGIYQMNQAGTTAARIDRNGTLSIIGTGGTEAAPVFNVDGKTGVLTSKANITTTGSVTAKTAQIGNASTANALALSVTGGAGVSQNLYVDGVTLSRGGLRVDGALPSGNAMVVNGKTAMLGNLSMEGNKIVSVAAGDVTAASKDAVNGSQLYTTNTALATEVTTRTNQVNSLESRKADKTYVDDKIVAEENARIAGDVDTLNSANTYTNQQVQAQSGNDRAYTDKQVSNERDRAMAAEAALGKEIKQVGAMAMAASAVGGATPVGDKKTAVSVAVGGYSGETAVAVGVTHMVKPNFKAFGAISSVSRGKTGVAVGASFSF